MSFAGLDRRLEKLEAQQPRVPAVVGIARRWAAEWDILGPRVVRTMAGLRAKRSAGEALEPLEARLLHLADQLVRETGMDEAAAVHDAVMEIAA